jgi:hypothetical protein
MSAVTVVDHGKQFGAEHWYTFYCPKCERQLERWQCPEKCSHCGASIDWPRAALADEGKGER